MIVYLDEFFEAVLRVQEVEAWGSCGFFFEGQVHAFMSAVLLGVTGLDAFDLEAESQPPDGESAESEQGMRTGEGDTVVGTDGGWQFEGFEGMFEHREGIGFFGGFKAFASEKVAGVVIGEGEGVAVFAIAQPELAFVIGTPQCIGGAAFT